MHAMMVLGETMKRCPIGQLRGPHRNCFDGEGSTIQESLHGCIIASVMQLANLPETLVSAARMLYTPINLDTQETPHACRWKKQSS
jgi:hypothetical protein